MAARRSRTGAIARALLALVILAPISVLFIQTWHSASAVVTTTRLETEGIAFLRALQPVLTTLTQEESLAVSQETVDYATMAANIQAATVADRRYGDDLQTHSRWSGFVSATNNLQRLGKVTPIAAFNAYSAVSDLLLDVYERIRDRSGLVRDQEPDVFYLEDAAARALPAGVVTAGQYGDSIVAEFGPVSGAQQALLNVSTYRALLSQDADFVTDDVTDAVDATASQTISGALLHDLEVFSGSMEALAPTITTPVTRASLNNESSSMQAKASVENAATTLSSSLFDEIESLVAARGVQARGKERQALIWLAVAILLVAVLLYLELRRPGGRRRHDRSGPDPVTPVTSGPTQSDDDRGGPHDRSGAGGRRSWSPADPASGQHARERSGVSQ